MYLIPLLYRNGNYLVKRYGSFTLTKRCLRKNEDFMPEFPDSIDLKISNRCYIGCPYCHESSIKDGKLADIEKLKEKLDVLKDPIEIAVGGGDILADGESKNLFVKLAKWMKSKSFVVNITINEASIKSEDNIQFISMLEKEELVNAIGISLRPWTTIERIEDINNSLYSITNGYSVQRAAVLQIVLGLLPLEVLDYVLSTSTSLFGGMRLLFLGYKQYGRAKGTSLPENLREFEYRIKKKIFSERGNPRAGLFNSKTYGFDNLALEQLNLSKALLKPEFGDIFLGPEFSCSMYIDAVTGVFAKTSRSDERVSWDSTDIITYFKHDKGKK